MTYTIRRQAVNGLPIHGIQFLRPNCIQAGSSLTKPEVLDILYALNAELYDHN